MIFIKLLEGLQWRYIGSLEYVRNLLVNLILKLEGRVKVLKSFLDNLELLFQGLLLLCDHLDIFRGFLILP